MEDLKCVDCGTLPPETESAYTLIGGKAGWRLTRHKTPEGGVVAEWRCPDCWQTYKKSPAAASLVGANAPAPRAAGAPPPPRQHDSMSPGRRRGS